MNLFQLQLLISFLVGGSFIAMLTLLAERASKRMAGLIIALPSTIALSYFFIAWTVGPQEIPKVAAVTPITVGISMLFTITYLYLSRLPFSKITSMIVSATGSLAVWFILALPLGYFHFSSLLISSLAQIGLCGVGYYFLTLKNKGNAAATPVHYSKKQILFRACFSGAVITLAVYLSKVAGPVWGGLFAGFPAVFTPTLLLMHWYHDSAFLFRIFHNVPIGYLQMLVFIIVASFAFPALGLWGGILASYVGALIPLMIISQLRKS